MTVKCTTWELIAFRAELSFKIFNFGWNFVNVGKMLELCKISYVTYLVMKDILHRSDYNGQKFREMRISHYVMQNIISRNIQCEFRKAENKAFLCVSPLFSSIFLGIFQTQSRTIQKN